MTDRSPKTPIAGGALMTLCILCGFALGIATGEITIGVLLGLAAGVGALIGVEIFQRIRR
ncbi:hypothetical protein [Stakelama saccharophila]|uniref:Glycine zipper family protein n=1 Tax=Stakelama saccharophila TaxID=3075605 RepID=A0ABZ0B7D3_9SPHN|nr:hypothetical protein [Stakelama sp. W311]WNO53293.1 hypothetical protein RPR59_12695 [Stakelama sp. W311]